MRQKAIFLLLAFLVFASSSLIFAAWEPLAPGFDYQEYTLTSPVPSNVFVTRMERTATRSIIDSCISQGKISGGLERVSGMANRYEETFGYWGEEWGKYRYDVIAAVNGSGFVGSTPSGGMIVSGWYAKQFGEFDGSGPVWQLDRDVWFGTCVRHLSHKNKVAYPATGQDQSITGINEARDENDDLIIYTSHYDSHTPSASDGVEVLVEMLRPTMILPPPSYAKGYVKEIRVNQGSTPIPFDHIVLSAEGPNADVKLLSNVSIGSEVRVSQEITHYDQDCSTPRGLDWTKTYSSVRYMTFYFLKDGASNDLSKSGASDRHPRTAVAYNDDYVYFVVVDGRDTGVSEGMNMQELGDFCKNYLGATDGMNMDGGGSSTMWVKGVVKNNPSDGSERYVSNGLMMILLQEKQESSKFASGNIVKTNASAPMRLGPGTNYSALTTIPYLEEGGIIEHSVNGIYAKGKYWWKCSFSSNEGWIDENLLELMPEPTPPSTRATRWEYYY